VVAEAKRRSPSAAPAQPRPESASPLAYMHCSYALSYRRCARGPRPRPCWHLPPFRSAGRRPRRRRAGAGVGPSAAPIAARNPRQERAEAPRPRRCSLSARSGVGGLLTGTAVGASRGGAPRATKRSADTTTRTSSAWYAKGDQIPGAAAQAPRSGSFRSASATTSAGPGPGTERCKPSNRSSPSGIFARPFSHCFCPGARARPARGKTSRTASSSRSLAKDKGQAIL